MSPVAAMILAFVLYFLAEAVCAFSFALVVEWIARKFPTRAGLGLKPFDTGVKYLCLGFLCGVVTIWIFPDAFAPSPAARIANLFLSPLMAGCGMTFIGKRRVRKGKEVFPMHKLVYGTVFAFGIAATRYFLVKT